MVTSIPSRAGLKHAGMVRVRGELWRAVSRTTISQGARVRVVDVDGLTLHVETLYGENNHHIVESCYKALARALRTAIEIDPRKADAVPSTKGTLGGSL